MGIIQCGSFTGNTTVNIGWEPQWIMIKRTDAAGDWIVIDSMRGCSVGGVDAVLNPNLANSESVSNDYIDFTATGFITKNLTGTYIYTVIRRPNKPPKSGTEVYNAIARTGTGTAATITGVGFAPDLLLIKRTGPNTSSTNFFDRLRGGLNLLTATTTNAESSIADSVKSFDMDGVSVGSAGNSNTTLPLINWFFRRAPGFFDVVCYTGTGVARTVNHSLGVVPELMIVKGRNTSGYNWVVYGPGSIGSKNLVLNGVNSAYNESYLFPSPPTSGVVNLSGQTEVNASGYLYISYLFASLPGISKVGSYTGNGSSQTIDCGFTTGARFILIKRTDNTGDWYVWDTARGIVAANDPHLSLNTTAAEVTTDDSVDPHASGFIVNQVAATNINVSGGSYIFLAIA